MIDLYRKNVVDLALTKLNRKYMEKMSGEDIFDAPGFTYYIYKELFCIDINESGYGIDNTTKQMTNNIGNLIQYSQNDHNKKRHIEEINIGDLVFFHKKSLDEYTPTQKNNFPGHVGIYLGNNKFIHASPEIEKITINEFDDYWINLLVASRDLIKALA